MRRTVATIRTELWFCLLAVGLLLTACAAGLIRDHTYISEAKGYRVQLPTEAWDVEVGKEADLVLRHRNGQAGIMVNATRHFKRRPQKPSRRHQLDMYLLGIPYYF